MDLINYSVKDFLLNESFQKWILELEEVNIFWEDWLNAHPDKISLITEAKSAIQSIKGE
jgi:transmembrane sensor